MINSNEWVDQKILSLIFYDMFVLLYFIIEDQFIS